MRFLLGLFFICFLSVRQEQVFICKSDAAYAYHNKYCQGLKKCTHTITKITLAEAISLGRKPCKYCYPASSATSVDNGQCKAITKKGTRCSRKAGDNGYCWQHGGG